MGKKNLDKAIMWYNKFHGFPVVAGEGVDPAISLSTNTSSTTVSSPPAASGYTTSEGTTNQIHSQSRSKNQDTCAQRGASPRSTASPLTPGSCTRRSPRLAVADAGNRHKQ